MTNSLCRIGPTKQKSKSWSTISRVTTSNGNSKVIVTAKFLKRKKVSHKINNFPPIEAHAVIQPSPHKKAEAAKPKKDESLSSFTSDDEQKPCKYNL